MSGNYRIDLRLKEPSNHTESTEACTQQHQPAIAESTSLKEHRKNEQQEKTIACLQKQIEALTAGLQKVNDKIELSKPARQTALSNP